MISIYHNMMWLSIWKTSKCGFEGKRNQKRNTHYLRIKCVLGKTFALIIFHVLLNYETDNINSFRM